MKYPFDQRIVSDHLESDEVGLLYLTHSCVMLRRGRRLFVFDYACHDQFPSDSFLGFCSRDAVEGYQVFIVHSHAHGDHWTPRVLELAPREGLHFLLSHDISVPETAHSITMCQPGGWITIGDLSVLAGPSSDEGIALLIVVDDMTIYFSGDNAFWDWRAERTADGWYRQWLVPFIEAGRFVDVAFQVADPRCHETHYGGIHHLSDYLDVGLLVPIHNFGDFSHGETMRELVVQRHPRQRYWNVTTNGSYLRVHLKELRDSRCEG